MVGRPISNGLQEKAKNELNEVSERIPEDLEKIREWLQKQPYIISRTDDQWLLTFLRGCKFSIERTKEKLDGYHTVRTLLPEYFKNRDPLESTCQEILKAGIILALPKTVDDVGPRIILYRLKNSNPTTMSIPALSKTFFMLWDILLMEDDNFAISGACLWVDFDSLPISYIFQVTPTDLKKDIVCTENAYPVRMNKVLFNNAPSLFEQLFNLITSLAPAKLKAKMSLYSGSNVANFYKELPQKYMPVEYGGENGSLGELTEYWKKKFEDYGEWFLKDEEYGTDEKLRPAKPKTSADLFGVEGSFRKLTVD